ncbi:unnamed protein product [Discosporangium mesarthrocarpum]
MDKSGKQLRGQLGRAPTQEELAAHMDVSLKRVRQYSNPPETTSLEGLPPWGGADGGGHERCIPDIGSLSPEELAEAELFHHELEELMSILSPDERRVLTLRFGLDGAGPTTLAEVAARSGNTKDRVRKVEAQALNKLRQPQTNHRLRGHMCLD